MPSNNSSSSVTVPKNWIYVLHKLGTHVVYIAAGMIDKVLYISIYEYCYASIDVHNRNWSPLLYLSTEYVKVDP